MENKGDVAVKDRQSQPSTFDVEACDLRSSEGERNDPEENEVFEEAVEPPLPRAVLCDSGDVSVLGSEETGASAAAAAAAAATAAVFGVEDGGLDCDDREKFLKSVDVQIRDQISGIPEEDISLKKFVESKNELISDLSAEGNGFSAGGEGERFVESVYVQASNWGSGNQGELISLEKFVESSKDLTDDLDADENGDAAAEVIHDTIGPIQNCNYAEALKLASDGKVDEFLADKINYDSLKSQEASMAEKMPKLLLGSEDVLIDSETAEETVADESIGVEKGSVGSEIAKDGLPGSYMVGADGRLFMNGSDQELIGVSSETGNALELDSDVLNVIASEGPGNVDSVELVMDESDANHVPESLEQIDHEDKSNQVDKYSVTSVGLSKEKARTEQNKEHSPKLENGYVTKSTPYVQTENQSSVSHVTNGSKEDVEEHDRDSTRSYNQQKVPVSAERDPVLRGNSGKSISGDNIDSISSQRSASSANSSPGHPAGAGLSSRPVGLGSSAPLLEPSGRSLQPPRGNGSVPQTLSLSSSEPLNEDAEDNDETREKLQMIRVKFLRLARRLGQTPHNVVVAQVLYRLGLAEQLRRNTNRPGVFGFERANVMAEQLEVAGQELLDFSCTIMVIGKTGVGKTATINSIFDEARLPTDAFQLGTKKVQEIVGMVQGIKVRVIDTPGLFTSSLDQRRNEKILHSVKRFIKKTPPDIVLYFDRLDMQSRDYGDVPLLRTITDVFGASIWFNEIVVLTHAASAPPDGQNGSPLSYEMFVTQRSHVVQQAIRQAAGDVRLMNPVSLVENHSACRMNRAGQRVLPNGQVWKPQLLLLSFASKILAEANMLLKLQDGPPVKAFGLRQRIPPLPFLLSSLLQSRPQPKLPEDQSDIDDVLYADSDDTSDLDESSEYDELPPFKPLTKAQLTKLSKAQKKAYFEELDYREKLLYKKQLKEEKQRRRQMKKMSEMAKDMPDDNNNENLEDENSGPASVPVPLPDFVLPNSFDSDYPSHRYRILDSSSQWLVRPVLDSHGWDHDIGYEGLNVERAFVIKNKIPVSLSGQLTKDKKDCTLQMEAASSIKHSEGKVSSIGLDMQTVGKDVAYTLRGESRFKNFRLGNTAAGISATYLGDSVSTGLKIEDKLTIGKRFNILLSGGAMTGRGEVACGGRLEAALRDRDYPIGRSLSTLALSVVDWHGELAIGCNVQSQLPLGRTDNVIVHGNFSNKGTGQVGIRLNSSENLQIALLALVPIFRNAKRMLLGSTQPT